MKKLNKTFGAILALFIIVPNLYARSVSITWNDETHSFEVPDEVADIVDANKGAIVDALNDYGVTKDDVTDALAKVEVFYGELENYGIVTTTPYTTATEGLDSFCDTLVDVLPNTQTQQNVWSEAWIGKLPHLGFGVNVGATELDIKALKEASNALGIDVADLRDSYALPTVTADIRLGGIILPFDVGFTVCSIDSSKIGALDSALDPVSFDFFTIGGDIRYAIFKGGGIIPRLSLGGGYYYTNGSVNVATDSSNAKLDFTSSTMFLSTQASVKLLFLVPFVGGRVIASKTKIDWKANADWSQIVSGNSEQIKQAQDWGILPTTFGGGSSNDYSDNIRPQLYGGLSLDLLILDLTASVCYDFEAELPSAAISARLSL